MNVLDLITIGMIVAVLGIMLMILGLFLPIIKHRERKEIFQPRRIPKMDEETKRRIEAGGVIIIGPIPIVFGTSKRIVKSLLILSIILMILAIALIVIPLLIFHRVIY